MLGCSLRLCIGSQSGGGKVIPEKLLRVDIPPEIWHGGLGERWTLEMRTYQTDATHKGVGLLLQDSGPLGEIFPLKFDVGLQVLVTAGLAAKRLEIALEKRE